MASDKGVSSKWAKLLKYFYFFILVIRKRKETKIGDRIRFCFCFNVEKPIECSVKGENFSV